MNQVRADRNNIIVSVIIPCFNHGQFLLEAIASVEACQGDFYEIIIVNDGSTDPLTCQVMTDLKQNGYFVIDQENQGIAAARNAGIKLAKGRYILPLDSDNKIRKAIMSKGVEVLDQNPEVGVVFGDIQFFSHSGKVHTFDIPKGYGFAEYLSEEEWIWRLPDFNLHRMVLMNYLDACALIRKRAWQECGGYDTKIPVKGFGDWELWLNIAKKGWKFHHVSSVFHDYRFIYDPTLKEWHVAENQKLARKYIRNKHRNLFFVPELQKNLMDLSRKISRKILHILPGQTDPNFESTTK